MVKKLEQFTKTFYYTIAGITLLVVITLVFVFLLGEDGLTVKPIVKKIYYADNISPTHQLLIDKFNKRYKGKIEVVPINLPFEKFSTNERKELLIRYLRSKSDRIDIFAVDQIWVSRFAKWAEPLDRYFQHAFQDKLIRPALKICQYNKELVAVPLYYDVGLLYYNDDILRKAQNYTEIKKELSNFITWERFVEISKQLKSLGKSVFLFPADDYEGLMCSYFELLGSLNQNIIEGDTVKLNTPEAVKSLQFLVDLIYDSKITPQEVLNFRDPECYKKFAQDNAVFLRGWTGFQFWYRDVIGPKDVSSKFLPVPLPHFKNGKPSSVIGGWDLMLSKSSKNKNEAIEFMKFMASEESQETMFESGGYLPINKDVYTSKEFLKKHPNLKFYEKIMDTGYYRPFTEKYTRYSDIITYYINLAMRKKISVSKALATAEKLINSHEFFLK